MICFPFHLQLNIPCSQTVISIHSFPPINKPLFPLSLSRSLSLSHINARGCVSHYLANLLYSRERGKWVKGLCSSLFTCLHIKIIAECFLQFFYLAPAWEILIDKVVSKLNSWCLHWLDVIQTGLLDLSMSSECFRISKCCWYDCTY